MKRICGGFTLVEIVIVVAIIGLLAAIAIPAFMRCRNEAQRKLCLTNLRQVEDAIENVMTSSNFSSTASVTVPMVNQYIKPGDVRKLFWPVGVTPPDEAMIQASGTNGLYVIFLGERLTTGRSG